jgi:TetR/AcrR family transcriptional regulator, lmrAB and yxaGH operons repressor
MSRVLRRSCLIVCSYRATAQQRGEDMVITIQGSLLVAQGMDNPKIFQRSVQQIPQQLCRDLVI